jgi:hypothetical protein
MKQPGQHNASVSLIAAHHVRQGLFASLALMLTLLATQQYHYWTQPAEPLIHTLHAIHAPAMNTVSASANQASRLQPVEESDQFKRPSETRWVF